MEETNRNNMDKNSTYAPKKKFLSIYKEDEKKEELKQNCNLEEKNNVSNNLVNSDGQLLIIDDNSTSDTVLTKKTEKESQKQVYKTNRLPEKCLNMKNFNDLSLSKCISEIIVSELNTNDDINCSSENKYFSDVLKSSSLKKKIIKDSSVSENLKESDKNDNDVYFIDVGSANDRHDHSKMKDSKKGVSETNFKNNVEFKSWHFSEKQKRYTEISNSNNIAKREIDKNFYINGGNYEAISNNPEWMKIDHSKMFHFSKNFNKVSPEFNPPDKHFINVLNQSHSAFSPHYLPFSYPHTLFMPEKSYSNISDMRHSPFNYHISKKALNPDISKMSSHFSYMSHAVSPNHHGKYLANDSQHFKNNSTSNSFPQKSEMMIKKSESPIDLSTKKHNLEDFEHQNMSRLPHLLQPPLPYLPTQPDYHYPSAQFKEISKSPFSKNHKFNANEQFYNSFSNRVLDENYLKAKSMKGFEIPIKPVEYDFKKHHENKFREMSLVGTEHAKLYSKMNELENLYDYHAKLDSLNRNLHSSLHAANYTPIRVQSPKLYPIASFPYAPSVPFDEHQCYCYCKICDKMFVGYEKLRHHFVKNHRMEPHPDYFSISSNPESAKKAPVVILKNSSSNSDFVKKTEGIKRVAEVYPLLSNYSEHQKSGKKKKIEDSLRFSYSFKEERLSDKVDKRKEDSEGNCQKCLEGFKDINDWKDHISLAHKNQDNRCKSCKIFFLSSEELEKHMQSKHPIERDEVFFKCMYCRMVFTNEEVLLVHTKEHEKVLSIASHFTSLSSDKHSFISSKHSSIQIELPDTTTCPETDPQSSHKNLSSPFQKSPSLKLETNDKKSFENKTNDKEKQENESKTTDKTSKASFKKKFFLKKFQEEELAKAFKLAKTPSEPSIEALLKNGSINSCYYISCFILYLIIFSENSSSKESTSAHNFYKLQPSKLQDLTNTSDKSSSYHNENDTSPKSKKHFKSKMLACNIIDKIVSEGLALPTCSAQDNFSSYFNMDLSKDFVSKLSKGLPFLEQLNILNEKSHGKQRHTATKEHRSLNEDKDGLDGSIKKEIFSKRDTSKGSEGSEKGHDGALKSNNEDKIESEAVCVNNTTLLKDILDDFGNNKDTKGDKLKASEDISSGKDGKKSSADMFKETNRDSDVCKRVKNDLKSVKNSSLKALSDGGEDNEHVKHSSPRIRCVRDVCGEIITNSLKARIHENNNNENFKIFNSEDSDESSSTNTTNLLDNIVLVATTSTDTPISASNTIAQSCHSSPTMSNESSGQLTLSDEKSSEEKASDRDKTCDTEKLDLKEKNLDENKNTQNSDRDSNTKLENKPENATKENDEKVSLDIDDNELKAIKTIKKPSEVSKRGLKYTDKKSQLDKNKNLQVHKNIATINSALDGSIKEDNDNDTNFDETNVDKKNEESCVEKSEEKTDSMSNKKPILEKIVSERGEDCRQQKIDTKEIQHFNEPISVSNFISKTIVSMLSSDETSSSVGQNEKNVQKVNDIYLLTSLALKNKKISDSCVNNEKIDVDVCKGLKTNEASNNLNHLIL